MSSKRQIFLQLLWGLSLADLQSYNFFFFLVLINLIIISFGAIYLFFFCLVLNFLDTSWVYCFQKFGKYSAIILSNIFSVPSPLYSSTYMRPLEAKLIIHICTVIFSPKSFCLLFKNHFCCYNFKFTSLFFCKS